MAGVPESAEDIDLLIDDYLERRMTPEQRKTFEERLAREPELRLRLNSTTQLVMLAEQALGWVTPGEDFDEKVNSKIVSMSQSSISLQAGRSGLTSGDPDARLFADPTASREKRRLAVIALIAGALFIAAVLALYLSLFKSP